MDARNSSRRTAYRHVYFLRGTQRLRHDDELVAETGALHRDKQCVIRARAYASRAAVSAWRKRTLHVKWPMSRDGYPAHARHTTHHRGRRRVTHMRAPQQRGTTPSTQTCRAAVRAHPCHRQSACSGRRRRTGRRHPRGLRARAAPGPVSARPAGGGARHSDTTRRVDSPVRAQFPSRLPAAVRSN
jgi:hypothetical protein